MIRQLIALLLVAGMVAGFVPVHATGTYQPANPQRIFFVSGSGTGIIIMNSGPAFTHCAASNGCAYADIFTWTNPNGIVGNVILDHAVFALANANSGTLPSGNMQAALFSTSAGAPVGTTALGVSATIPISSTIFPNGNCGSAALSTYTFTGANQYPLSVGTTYAIVIEMQNSTNIAGDQPTACGPASGATGYYYGNPGPAWQSNPSMSVYTELWVDPPTVQGAVSQGSYLYSTMFSFFAVAIMLGLIFNRDHPIVKEYGAKAIVILGLMLVILWTVGLLING